jgi:AcrR family transcriptional regulator
MPLQARQYRDCVDNVRHLRPTLSARELDREERILDSAKTIMIHHGRAGLTMAGLANAMRMAAATIRRHFPDIDSILAHLLHQHLRDMGSAFCKVPFDHPNRQAALRGAYIDYTRTGFGAPTGIHALLLYERHALPPDLFGPIDKIRDSIGIMLADDRGDAALALLDTVTLKHEQIEFMLGALANPPAPAKKLHPSFPQTPERPKSKKPFLVNKPCPPPALIHARAGP